MPPEGVWVVLRFAHTSIIYLSQILFCETYGRIYYQSPHMVMGVWR